MANCLECAHYEPRVATKCWKDCKSAAKGGKGCRGFNKRVIQIDHRCSVPELQEIYCKWHDLADAYVRKHGNIGTCVLGAGFNFTYKGTPYRMDPRFGWQGSITWEESQPDIRKMLEDLGCENINYRWGNMD